MSDGSYKMDLEAALAALPPAIEESLHFVNVEFPNARDKATEIAAEVGAKELITCTEVTFITIASYIDLYKAVIGEEGDSVETGSAQGLYRYARRTNADLNGED